MTLPAIYSFVSKIGIPKKKEGKEVRYSKRHFDAAKALPSRWNRSGTASQRQPPSST